jgi:hypothetical protein
VKKCTSCAKDLPDSAHHCVFCGAKQAPAPVPGAAQQQAKTVLGYQAADVVKEMQRQGVSVPRPGGGSNPPIGTAPTLARPGGPSPMTPMQPMQQPPPPPHHHQQQPGMQQMPQPPHMQPQMQPAMPMPGPTPASQAATVFIQGGAGPGPLPVQSAPIPLPQHHAPSAPVHMPQASAPSAPVVMPNYQAPSAPMQMPNYPPPPAGVPMPMHHAPSGPAAPPPYLASQTALRASRPVEPFADGLKLVLLAFGILLLGAFATPLSTRPAMAFHWDVIIHAPGMAKLFSLMLVTTGALALVIALTPLQAVPRGAIAAGTGLFIILTPIIQAGTAEWTTIVKTIGSITLVAGLLVRHEYREAMLGRVLATIGAVAVLVIYLIPVGGGDVPLIGMFRALVDAPAEYKIAAILLLLPAILAIVSLLVWLPAPSSAGAKVLAWAWIILPAVTLVATMLLGSGGDVAEMIKASPFTALMAWVAAAAGIAFVGYGVATIAGKQLE